MPPTLPLQRNTHSSIECRECTYTKKIRSRRIRTRLFSKDSGALCFINVAVKGGDSAIIQAIYAAVCYFETVFNSEQCFNSELPYQVLSCRVRKSFITEFLAGLYLKLIDIYIKASPNICFFVFLEDNVGIGFVFFTIVLNQEYFIFFCNEPIRVTKY